MHVEVDRRVFLDLQNAMEFYEGEAGSDMAATFYDEFLRCRELVRQRPRAFPVIAEEIRRINLHRFPYHILYRILDGDVLRILVVKHDRRDPDLGLDR